MRKTFIFYVERNELVKYETIIYLFLPGRRFLRTIISHSCVNDNFPSLFCIAVTRGCSKNSPLVGTEGVGLLYSIISQAIACFHGKLQISTDSTEVSCATETVKL